MKKLLLLFLLCIRSPLSAAAEENRGPVLPDDIEATAQKVAMYMANKDLRAMQASVKKAQQARQIPGRIKFFRTQKEAAITQFIADSETDPALAEQAVRAEQYLKHLPTTRMYEKLLYNQPTLAEKIRQSPITKLSGGISYFMSLDEIKKVAQNAMQQLKDQGKIITPAQFQEIEQAYHFVSPQHTDLTRIWGANYLKAFFIEHHKSGFDVPDYVIVTEDPQRIELTLNLANTRESTPIIAHLSNSKIYFKKIDGVPNGTSATGDQIKASGYTDYKTGDKQKERNIIHSFSNGINYVVDTEIKSFNATLPLKGTGISEVYLADRFLALEEPELQGFNPALYPVTVFLE
jgi:hypothetical protein